jgi:hypothetical protein
MRCLRKELSRLSSVIIRVFLPISLRNFKAISFIGPKVSIAIGMNSYVEDKSLYLSIFLVAANSAAPPADMVVACR